MSKPITKLQKKLVEHVAALVKKHEHKISEAIEESSNHKLTLSFAVVLDLSGADHCVTTAMRFGENGTESGLEVHKTFKDTSTDLIADPNQVQMESVVKEAEKESKRAKKGSKGKKGKADETTAELTPA
jgi:hypothetical protein